LRNRRNAQHAGTASRLGGTPALADSTQYDDYSSGRNAVFKLLGQNPHLSLAELMEKLRKKTVFCYLKHQTVKNYMTQWRQAYSRDGVVPRLHRGLGRLNSGFAASLWETAPSFGWNVSKNKNHHRCFFRYGVYLDWHRNGTILFRFKGSITRGFLLGVFSQAFWDPLKFSGRSESELSEYLRALFSERYRQIRRDVTYETGQPLPRTVIDRKKGYGEIIKLGDGSHPTSLEIEETTPFWVSELKEIGTFFGENMKKHVEVVAQLGEESKKRQEALERILRPMLLLLETRLQKLGG